MIDAPPPVPQSPSPPADRVLRVKPVNSTFVKFILPYVTSTPPPPRWRYGHSPPPRMSSARGRKITQRVVAGSVPMACHATTGRRILADGSFVGANCLQTHVPLWTHISNRGGMGGGGCRRTPAHLLPPPRGGSAGQIGVRMQSVTLE